MSDPVSALDGARFEGYVTVADAGLRGMIALRGDFADTAFGAALERAGLSIPAPLTLASDGARGVAWMSPDELLVLCGYDEAPALATDLAEALAGTPALVATVSDMRAVFSLEGARAHELLRKLSPLPVDDLTPGAMRRSRLAQVPAAIYARSSACYEVFCFRSQARYVYDLLSNAATPGSEIGVFGS